MGHCTLEGQAIHEEAPNSGLYVFSGHGAGAAEPAKQKLPRVHRTGTAVPTGQ